MGCINDKKGGRMKNILIVGGSYFAGKIFVEELIKENKYNIHVFNRGNRPLNKDITEIKGDRENTENIKNNIPDMEWDVLVDFCAYNPDHISKMINNLPGTLKHYIFISTTSIYKTGLDIPVTEEAPKLTASQPELGPYADYGYHKWLAECRLKEDCTKKGIAFTCLRPSIIYGEYNYAPRETWFFDQIRDEKEIVLPDPGLALFSFVYVVDLAHILIKSILNKNMFGREFNVASEELISYLKFYDILRKISGKDFKIDTMNFETINNKRIEIPFPPDLHLVYSGRKLQEILNFKFIPFIDGMKQTYNYYQRVQEIKSLKTNDNIKEGI